MGRPKVYVDAAAKHRAYRARLAAETVRVDRRRWAALVALRDRVGTAVNEARWAGCPVARQIIGSAADTILESLAAWFEQRAAQEWPVQPKQGKTRPRSKP